MKRGIDWTNVAEQALGTLLASGLIAAGAYLIAVLSGRQQPTAWLYVGIAALASITAFAAIWRRLAALMRLVGRLISRNWQMIAGFLLFAVGSYMALSYTSDPWAIAFMLAYSLLLLLLMRSLYRRTRPFSREKPSITGSPSTNSKAAAPPRIPVRRQFGPELERVDTREWIQPLPGFKPIPLGNSIVNCTTHPSFPMPFAKPLLGLAGVPFDLNLQHPSRLLRGIEHAPNFPSDLERSQEILPGASRAIAGYALLTAGNAHRIVDNVEFDGMRIGYIEFYFSEGSPYRLELILGLNIRDWSYRHPDVVQTLADGAAEQAWRDPSNQATIDLLRIDMPEPPRNVKYCQICAQYASVLAGYTGPRPSIRLSGLTYEIDEGDPFP